MTFPAYPEYKDSRVGWLGDVPAHWGIKRLKYGFRLVTERAESKENPVALENIESWSGRYVSTEADFSGEGIAFDAGDILFGKLRPYLAKAYLTELRGAAIGDFHVLRALERVEPSYGVYYILNEPFISAVNSSTYGAKMPRVGWDVMGSVPFLQPPRGEQRKICSFLDHETARIDALIDEQQRLIELLKEKRQAVISHAVTKGLDPDVPMKDSGVEWLGEMPAHWGVGRVKNVTSFITSGPRGWSDFLDEDGTGIFLQSGDLDDGLGVNFAGANRISVPTGAEGIRTRVHESDVVVCITGANTGRVAVIQDVSEVAYVNQHLALVRPENELCREMFLGFALSCNVCQSYFRVEQYGLKEGLSLTDVAEAPLALPPLEEQAYIVNRVADTLNGLDDLASNAAKMVELLRERRNALISSAVTGKIDVRGWQPPVSETESPHHTTSELPA